MHLLAWSLCIRRSHKHKLRQQRPTADRLATRESDCSRMRRKVSSHWLPSFIKATRPVLEILNMAGVFWDRPRISKNTVIMLYGTLNYISMFTKAHTGPCPKWGLWWINSKSLYILSWRSILILSHCIYLPSFLFRLFLLNFVSVFHLSCMVYALPVSFSMITFSW
jgi:hypothetical protein